MKNKNYFNTKRPVKKMLAAFLALITCCLMGTIVNAQTTLLSEGFESGVPPSGWANLQGGSGNVWSVASYGTPVHTGTGAAEVKYNSSFAANAWLITPGQALTGGTVYTITYWEKTYPSSYPERLKVTVGTAQTIAAQTTILQDLGSHFSGSYTLRTTTYTPGSSGTYYFAWNCYSLADEFYQDVDDILITFPSGACSGTPSPGNTVLTAGVNPACSGASFTLGLQNSTSGTGVTYQWQSSPNNSTWTNFGGGLASQATSQTSATYYRCLVTCSGNTGTSASLQVTMNSNTCQCITYCSPTYTSYDGTDYIGTFAIYDAADATQLFLNTSGATPNPGYANFTGLSTPTLNGGQQYHIHITTGSSSNEGVAVWIDYNGNGTFDAIEQLGTTTGVAAGSNLNYTFTVPVTVTTGNARMRAVINYATNPVVPCVTGGYGETEDYCINLFAPPPCSGTPAPGNTVSSVPSACSGTNFNLSLQNTTSGTGVTYQWQTSPDGLTWSNGAGASTNVTYTTSQTTATYYHCLVTCSGNTGTSNPLQVTMNTFLSCYCQPTMFPTNTYSYINSVTTTGAIANISSAVDAGFTSNNAPGFNYYTSPVISQAQGSAFNVIVQAAGTGVNSYFSVWIDYNESGTFDPSELVVNNIQCANTATTFSIPIPFTATAGTTRMRVIDWTNGSPPGVCADLSGYYGETEDYLVNIIVPAGCSGTPAASNTQSSTNPICSGTSFTLSLSTVYSDAGLSFDWQSSPNGSSWTSTGGTAATYATTQTSDTYYRCIITCANGGATATSASFLETTVGCINMTNGSSTTCSANFYDSGGPTGQFVNNENYTYTFFPNPGNLIRVAFSAFGTENLYDGLSIYNGPSTSSPLISSGLPAGNNTTTCPAGSFYGTNSPGTLTSSDPSGALTFKFTSDVSGTDIGWAAVISCIAQPNCSGTPNPGNTISSSGTTACNATSFTLSLQNTTTDAGQSYQWQTSPDGITWANAGPTTITWTTTQAVTTWYQCIVTCAGNGSTASTPLQLTQSVCYCTTPNYSFAAGCGYALYINNFTFAGINNTSGCNGIAPYYTYYSSMTANVFQTGSFPISISTPSGTPNYYETFKVYIDYNDNGSFEDAGETVYNSGMVGTNVNASSGVIVFPINAPLGTHRLRVRSDDAPLGTNSCSEDGTAGEVEDYNITISGPPACSGTPTPGITFASTPLACSSTSIALSLQNATPGSGVTYQWQSSTSGSGGPWTDVGTSISTLAITESATSWYQCVVTCSGNSGTSTPVQVNYSVPCYCTSPPNSEGDGCAFGLYINNFTFAGINNTSGCYAFTPYTAQYYSYFPTLTATAQQNQSYALSITTPPNGAYSEYFAVYIDFNDNGSFEDAGEMIYSLTTTTDVNTASSSITIPLSAPVGTHKLRVRSGNYAINSCSIDGGSGEVEDYNITITAAPACNGTPNPGNTLSTASSVCPGQSFTISLQNLPDGNAGYSYVWQWSDDGGLTWAPVPGIGDVSSFSYTQSSYWIYRCEVTCSGSGLSAISTPVTVNENAANQCYCTPVYTSYDGTDFISNVTLNTLNNSSGNTPLPGYINYSPLGTSLNLSVNYDLTITIGGSSSESVGAWIDFNQSGTFDAGEMLGQTTGLSGPTTFNFTVPSNAMPGITRLRTVAMYGAATVIPCPTSGYGETEDYQINLGDPNCISSPSFPANGAQICPDPSLALSWPAKAGAIGYDVYFDAVDGTTPVSMGQGGTSYSPSSVSSTQTYFWKVVPQYSSGSCSTPQVWSFSFKPAPDPLASSNAPVCQGIDLTLFGNNNATGQTTGNTWSWSGPSFSSVQQNPTISSSSAANNGTYTLTVTNSLGCTASYSTNVLVNPNPVLTIGTQTNVSCNGMSDGQVDLDASTGTSPFLFDLDGNQTVDGIYTGLPAGTYTATVNDDNGCSATSLTVTITEPDVLTVGAGSNSPVCTGTSLNLSATPAGGTSGYSYVWTGPNGPIPSVQNPTIASATASDAGNYSVVVTDAHSCTATSANHLVQVNISPTAAIALVGSPNKCLGQSATVQLTFTGTGPWNYTITGNGGPYSSSTSSNPVNVNVTPISSGVFNYTVTSIGNASCPTGGTASGSATVNVSTVPPPSSGPIPTGAAEACANTVMLITSAVMPGQNIIYSWNTGTHSSLVEFSTSSTGPWSAGPFQTTTSQVYVKFGALGGGLSGYYICLQGVNGCGSSINKCLWIRGIVSGPGPITPPDSVVACPNTTKSYSCGTSAGASVYSWTLGGSAAPVTSGQGTNNVQVTFPAGFVSGQLCVTAALSCGGASTSAPRCMYINNNPANPTVLSGAAAICPGATGVSYSIPAVPGASGYNWTVPANATIATGANSTSITVNFPTPYNGSPSVCVSATSACGTSAARCKTVVSGIPNQPAGITGPLTNICGSTVQYSVVNPVASSYAWTNPTGTTISGSATGSTILLNVSPTFTNGFLTVVANSALCPPATSASRTSSTFYGRPNNPGAITANPALWCPGQGVNFSVIPIAPLPTYTWTVSNGTIDAGQGSSNIDVTWGASVSGTVTVSASNGCGPSAGTSSQSFSSGCREEGINASSASAFSVYPNPAHDKVTVSIDVKENADFTLQLTDISGRVVLSENRSGLAGLNIYELNISHLSKGVYMLEVKSVNDNWRKKVIVE